MATRFPLELLEATRQLPRERLVGGLYGLAVGRVGGGGREQRGGRQEGEEAGEHHPGRVLRIR